MKKTTALFLTMVFAASVLYAEEGDKKSFWGKLLNKGVSPAVGKTDKNYKPATAVCGIRGAKDESAEVLYWKDKESKPAVTVTNEECDKFDAAVALAMDGKNEESLKNFEEFIATYPASTLCADANEAIKKLKEEKKD